MLAATDSIVAEMAAVPEYLARIECCTCIHGNDVYHRILFPTIGEIPQVTIKQDNSTQLICCGSYQGINSQCGELLQEIIRKCFFLRMG